MWFISINIFHCAALGHQLRGAGQDGQDDGGDGDTTQPDGLGVQPPYRERREARAALRACAYWWVQALEAVVVVV